ncbi:hypothetical protein BH11PLA1_BH11PLA1_07370 [soil metagenome]
MVSQKRGSRLPDMRHRIPSTILSRIVPCAALGAFAAAALAGPLTPPAGPVASTLKPLAEVEPRTVISATNTPGDADSVYKITQPGSYYLTGNLTGVSAKDLIEIGASNVTLDLNGFALLGVAGSLNGISDTTDDGDILFNITVKNGTVANFSGSGIRLPRAVGGPVRGLRIEGVSASGNVAVGINATNGGASILFCTASSNGASGISAGSGSVVIGCTATLNTSFGIRGDGACTIVDCAASSNGTGISLGARGVISRCTAQLNAGDGFAVSSGRVTDCNAVSNGDDGFSASGACVISGCLADNNTGDGIQVGAACLVERCHCNFNGAGTGNAAGIHVALNDNRIEGNTCLGADRGIDVDIAGNFIARNICTGNTLNWDVVGGNVILVINAATSVVAISGNSGGVAPGSTDPNANFTY